MKKNKYSFLNDPRALAEIRKHKWIESQKNNQEIGFATAAVDWIARYGEEWKRVHVTHEYDASLFIERRKYRRFNFQIGMELIKEGRRFLAQVINMNVFGVLCRSSRYVAPGSALRVALPLIAHEQAVIACDGVIQRAHAIKKDEYEMFFEFDPRGQEKIACLTPQWPRLA